MELDARWETLPIWPDTFGIQNTCYQLLMWLTSTRGNGAIILRSRKSFRITCTTSAELCEPALLSHDLLFAARRSR